MFIGWFNKIVLKVQNWIIQLEGMYKVMIMDMV